MGILSKLFGKKPSDDLVGVEMHLVRVHIPCDGDFERYTPLEDLLSDAVERNGVGSVDGNEMGGGEYTIWLYGAQADLLAQMVKKTLTGQELPAGSYIYIREGAAGDPNSQEETWPLN